MINWSFDDVLIEPQLGIVEHRADIDLSTNIGVDLKIPVLSAPMDTVTNAGMARAMDRVGGAGVLHRFQTIEQQVVQYLSLEDTKAYVAIGINEGLERVNALLESGCNNFVLDVAHAHTLAVGRFLKTLPLHLNLVVGSIATSRAVWDLLEYYPIMAFRVGIGGGAACITREVTGAGVPQLSAIMRCADAAQENDVAVIADGGIRNSGDIVKAIVAGADAVMLGYLLAGTCEAPQKGHYWGMASHVISDKTPEGVVGRVEDTGLVADVISNLMGGLRSGISYAGGDSVSSIKGRTNLFKEVTPTTMAESRARI